MTDEAWFVVRNTPGVTGFIGTGTQPTPVSEKEIAKIKMPDLNCTSLESAMSMVAGTARSMGVTVED